MQLRNELGESFTYRIVGPDEADAKSFDISIDSALAMCLLGKRVGGEVLLAAAGTSTRYTIEGVHYA